MKLWPFKVISGASDKPVIQVQFMGEEKMFHRDAVSFMVLSQMKEIAETYLGTKVNDAVVTVQTWRARLPRILVSLVLETSR